MPGHVWPVYSSCCIALWPRLVQAFDRDRCFSDTQRRLTDHSLAPTSPYFYRDPASRAPYHGVGNMTLTLHGCTALCGARQTWYADIGPRMTTWLVPVMLLVANIELSPLDKRRFLSILHVLGDPIDSLRSLLHKLDAAAACDVRARTQTGACPSCRRVISTVFSGLEEIHGPDMSADGALDTFVRGHIGPAGFVPWRRAAVRLASGRTNEIFRGTLAIAIYILQLIAAFIPAVGGDSSSPPGGRIATVVLLSWLLPIILLTNLIGHLPSSRTAYDIVNDLAISTGTETSLQLQHRTSTFLPQLSALRVTKSTDYWDALVWAGGIYTYRPWQRINLNSHHHRFHPSLVATMCVGPLLAGFAGAVLILWYQVPVGPNCPHAWVLAAMILWFFSFAFNWVIRRTGVATGFYQWRATMIKDAVVAVPILLIMFLSAAGVFNFCWCWSGPLQYPGGKVPLLNAAFVQNDKTVYPAIVGGTLLLQLIIFASMVYLWLPGFRVLRWRDQHIRAEWDRISGRVTCRCIEMSHIWFVGKL